MVRKTITTVQYGRQAGTFFDGKSSIKAPETAFIQGLAIEHGAQVDKLTVSRNSH